MTTTTATTTLPTNLTAADKRTLRLFTSATVVHLPLAQARHPQGLYLIVRTRSTLATPDLWILTDHGRDVLALLTA